MWSGDSSDFKIRSPLVNSIWKAWNQIKGLIVQRNNKAAIPLLAHDSIWWPLNGRAQTNCQDVERPMKLHELGFKVWGDLWDHSRDDWTDLEILQEMWDLEHEDVNLLLNRRGLIQ